MINNYPYTDFHELNLDWLVNNLQRLENRYINNVDAEMKAYIGETMRDKLSCNAGMVRRPIDPYVANEIIECAMTYYAHNDSFIYGNQTALNRDLGITSNHMQIDCSTFICLVMNGIPYESSRYAHPTEGRESNKPSYPWATDMYSYKEEDPDGRGYTEWRRYAQMIAWYNHINGYNYTPKEDFSNCCTGDIIYVTNNDTSIVKPDGSMYNYRHISHGYLFINRVFDTVSNKWKMRCIDASDGDHPVIALKLIEWPDEELTDNRLVEASRPCGNAINYSVSPDICSKDGSFTLEVGFEHKKTYALNRQPKIGYNTVIIKPSGDVIGNIKVNMGATAAVTAMPYYAGTYIAYVRNEEGISTVSAWMDTGSEPCACDWIMCFEGAHCYPLASYER